mgnify:CR=1 FL=1
MYYARVVGDFRKICKETDNPKKSSVEKDNEVNKIELVKDTKEELLPKILTVSCDKWLYCISNIEATWGCEDKNNLPFEHRKTAKEALTIFKCINYCPKTD